MSITNSRDDFERRLGVLNSKKDQYKDIDLKFRLNPITNDVMIKKDGSAISQSLRNIVLTNYFERPFNPKFGGNVWAELFEPMDEFSVINITNRMKEAISLNELRINVVDIGFQVDSNENTVNFTIY